MKPTLRLPGMRVPACRLAACSRALPQSLPGGHFARPLAWLTLFLAVPGWAAAAEPASNPAAEAAAVAPASAPAAAPAPAPLRYRKVFLPSEAIRKLESSALRDEAFVPLKRAEFERLLGAVGTKSSAPQAASSPQVSQGVYTALLNGELLVGTAGLTIVPGADPGAALSLEPCNLVVSQPVWRPAPTVEASAAAALPPGADSSADASAVPPAPPEPPSGVPPMEWGCDDRGQLVALVNSPGVLQFAWSRRAVRNASGELAFDLRFPQASVNQLRLS
ncbi:MAG: hypothetical protein MUF25_03265, partial [Pirellulaceae bacterium]|nr:hypothetical protein [Pirellulaceae bacterium]